MPLDLPNLDFVAISKLLGTVLTGLFGLLALLTRYKTEDGRITKWGAISAVGIVFFALMGVLSQFKEMANAEQARQENARKSLEIAQQTQRIAEQTQASVVTLERLLQPLDVPSLSLQFKVPCADPTYSEFCKAARDATSPEDIRAWKKWPSATVDGHRAEILIVIHVYATGEAKRATSGRKTEPNWTLEYNVAPGSGERAHNSMVFYVGPDDELAIEIQMDKPQAPISDGKLASLLDLEGAEMRLSVSSTPKENFSGRENAVTAFKPDSMELLFRNGRRVSVAGDGFARRGSIHQGVDKAFSARITLK